MILGVAVVLALALAASGPAARAQVAQTFRTPLSGEAPTLDPYYAVDSASAPIVFLMYNTLVGLDANGRILPQAATSWDTSPNGLVYTFHLRDDMYFHTGRKA